LLGGTSGRTTLNGEGLQHEDGHSHVFSATIPNCVSYDPTYSYEVAVILQHGLERMYGPKGEDVYYYLTLLNENYEHPGLPEGAEDGIIKGAYLLKAAPDATPKEKRIKLLGSGAILREVIAGAALLEKDFGIHADIFSVTSFTELKREADAAARWNLLHPLEDSRVPYITQLLSSRGDAPTVASTDYIRAFAEQIRAHVPGVYKVLGTDGFGRSDYRRKLRGFFEVDRHFVAVTALKALAEAQLLPAKKVAEAIELYSLDPEKPDPTKT
jgi:pyruvate dehydrogenase E1 component